MIAQACDPSTQAQQQAVEMASRRGRVVLFGGVPKGKLTELDTNIIHYNQLQVLGHFGYDHLENYNSFKLIASEKIQAKRYITHVLPLEDIMKGLELTKSGEALKVILKP